MGKVVEFWDYKKIFRISHFKCTSCSNEWSGVLRANGSPFCPRCKATVIIRTQGNFLVSKRDVEKLEIPTYPPFQNKS